MERSRDDREGEGDEEGWRVDGRGASEFSLSVHSFGSVDQLAGFVLSTAISGESSHACIRNCRRSISALATFIESLAAFAVEVGAPAAAAAKEPFKLFIDGKEE